MKPLLLIFEGVDFTGKSTIARKITKILDGIYFSTPNEEYMNQFHKKLIDPNLPTSERCKIILNGLTLMLPEIEALLANNKTVILDRWKWTTLAYHFSLDNQFWLTRQKNWEKLTSEIKSGDFEFLTHIPNETVWQQRFLLRSPSPRDKALASDPQKRQKILDFYLKLNPSFKMVDNSGTLDESTKQVLGALEHN